MELVHFTVAWRQAAAYLTRKQPRIARQRLLVARLLIAAFD